MIEQRPANSGNYQTGRSAQSVDRVVIHVADGTYSGTLSWFADPAAHVSAHYTVATDGRTGQSVQERDTAFHAGDLGMNRRSVGIEHEGRQNLAQPWKPTAEQVEASAQLTAAICRRWRIPVDRQHLIGHNEVNPDRAARKNCPGTGWPWAAFIARVGELAAGPEVAAHQPDPADHQAVRVFDPQTNRQIGTGTLIRGTDKVYLPADVLAQWRATPQP